MIVFLDRELKYLHPTGDRPLSSDRERLKKLYRDRYDIYVKTADAIVKNNGTFKNAVGGIVDAAAYSYIQWCF